MPLKTSSMNKFAFEKSVSGLQISEGIAFGTLFMAEQPKERMGQERILAENVPQELQRFKKAIHASKEEMLSLLGQINQQSALKEDALILSAHLSILEDPFIHEEIETEISSLLVSSEFALNNQLKKIKKQFKEVRDPFFQVRFQEIGSLIQRVIGQLKGSMKSSHLKFPSGVVLYAKGLSSFDIMELNPKHVAALLTELDGRGSHAAIAARARGIPYITKVSEEEVRPYNGAKVIVDAKKGTVIFYPEKETECRYKQLQMRQVLHRQFLKRTLLNESETIDGYHVRLSANVDFPEEVNSISQYSIHGIGLFRTELAFLSAAEFPSEEEQYRLYADIVKRMEGLPVVIRTFDVGADKKVVLKEKENNPFLGCRAIRFMLKEPEIFKAQLRAILRASLIGNVRILFPMVATLRELLEAKKLVAEAISELSLQGVKVLAPPAIGAMIEVPSAALITDLLAQECAFLSIGTNDLVQYSLAADRTNIILDELYSPAHPSVLRLLKWIVSEANHYQVPISICGEMAADPKFIPLLLGLGIQELSVPLRDVSTVKEAIRRTSIVDAHALIQKLLTMRFSSEIEEALREMQKR